MPELPEVESVVRQLDAAGLGGSVIHRARVFWPRTVAKPSPRSFSRSLAGARFLAPRRRGKFIVLDLEDGRSILVHLRMTGRLTLGKSGAPREPHEQVILDLADGRDLRFRDPRKFGRWYLLDVAEEKLGELGPEPLAASFSSQSLARELAGRRGMLKPLLLNQAFLAGIGNIYADEALFLARLHPQRTADTLSSEQIRDLHRAIRRVLREGIRASGTSLGDASTNYQGVDGQRGRHQFRLKVFQRTGEPCLRCRTPIRRIVLGQRSTHFCPQCQ